MAKDFVDFVPGLELSARFYHHVVRPLLEHRPHTAALIGPGSEILGFDTERSTDHDWGARLQIFTPAPVSLRLHDHFAGHPVSVTVADLGTWLTGHLGFDPRSPVSTADWLATPTQTLAEVTAGAVFHDGLAELEPARRNLAWYPADVWRYVLAGQWRRIAQEEHLMGRCGEAGDELGSAITAARLARDLIRLTLLMHRRYPPYGKWLGTALTRLTPPGDLPAVLASALAASPWQTRERHLSTAYRLVAEQHNALALTPPLSTHVRPFHDRPFQVIGADRFATALIDTITDESLRARPLTGAIDQYVDNTDVLTHRDRSRHVARVPPVPGTSVT